MPLPLVRRQAAPADAAPLSEILVGDQAPVFVKTEMAPAAREGGAPAALRWPVQKHGECAGGQIGVESPAREGAAFLFTLTKNRGLSRGGSK